MVDVEKNNRIRESGKETRKRRENQDARVFEIKFDANKMSNQKLEQLDGIRNNRKHARKFNYSLHSWSFYQLQNFMEYKAKLCGIPLTYVEPKNTSKECSRCGNIGIRNSKKFVCHSCGHVDHADANASFNIVLRQPINSNIGQLNTDRDVFKGSTDMPRGDSL